MKYDILVNKDNPISKDFEVENLVSVGKHYSSDSNSYTNKDILLEETAAFWLKKMLEDANETTNIVKVIPHSGYRSIEYQIEVMNYYIQKEGEELAKKRVAEPGTSEHHTGLAIDIAIFKNGKFIEDVSSDEPIIEYLHKNCYKYGFILRYPKDKINVTGIKGEPWHFRYVGEYLAKYLFENDLTLEEYYNNLH